MKKYYFNNIKIFIVVFLCSISKVGIGQLVVDTSSNYYQLVNSLASSNLTISNVTYTGNMLAFGKFSNGNTTNLGMDSGIVLSTGRVTYIPSPSTPNISTNFNGPGNAQLTSLVGYPTHDAATLQFSFIPAGDTVLFNYVFASADYYPFVDPFFVDPLTAYFSGPNPAGGSYNQNLFYVPSTTLMLSVFNINDSTNSQYFINNDTGSTIVYVGFTTVLQAKFAVVPLASYSLQIAIADGTDYIYDTGVFLNLTSYGLPTGVSQNIHQDADIFIYPNPAFEELSVTMGKGKKSLNGNIFINICNFLGEEVLTTSLSSTDNKISISSLPPGVYFINVRGEGKNLGTKKFVKM